MVSEAYLQTEGERIKDLLAQQVGVAKQEHVCFASPTCFAWYGQVWHDYLLRNRFATLPYLQTLPLAWGANLRFVWQGCKAKA